MRTTRWTNSHGARASSARKTRALRAVDAPLRYVEKNGYGSFAHCLAHRAFRPELFRRTRQHFSRPVHLDTACRRGARDVFLYAAFRLQAVPSAACALFDNLLSRDVPYGALPRTGFSRDTHCVCRFGAHGAHRLHFRRPRTQHSQGPLRHDIRDGVSGAAHLACVDARATLLGGVRHTFCHIPARGRGHVRVLVRQYDRRKETLSLNQPQKDRGGICGRTARRRARVRHILPHIRTVRAAAGGWLRSLYGRDVEIRARIHRNRACGGARGTARRPCGDGRALAYPAVQPFTSSSVGFCSPSLFFLL